jgi:hypothetical protein
MLKRGRPQCCIDRFGPTVGGVKQGSSSMGSNVFNARFGPTVLMVGIDTAEGQ